MQPPTNLPPDLMVDFDQEALRLRQALGLDGSASAPEHHDADILWKDPKTGAAIWVGNESAAKGPLSDFRRHRIGAVVNCTEDMPNFLEGAGPLYYRFNVAHHARHSADPSSLAMFVGKLFVFIDNALARGISVLVHCLAGAHRAGTTGCLLLMYKEGLDPETAVRTAQSRRPIINPIGNLPLLLRRYEALREHQHEEVWAEAEAARVAQEQRMRAVSAARGTATAATGRDRVQQERAAAAVANARAASRAAAEEEEEEDEPTPLEACLEALNMINERADYAYAHAHHVRLSLEERAQQYIDAAWTKLQALEMNAAAAKEANAGKQEEQDDDEEEEYEDDFEEEEEDDDEREAAARSPGYLSAKDDLAQLRQAVEESRQAVRNVEERLGSAEATEPGREAHVAASTGALLAASVANALGVSREDAMAALQYTNGDLEKAVHLLTRHMLMSQMGEMGDGE